MQTTILTHQSITQKEFDRRVKYNTELFNSQQDLNEFTPSKYYLWDQEPKLVSTLQYCGMDHDIYAAAVTGTLAISAKDKHDSILMKNGKPIEVELKTTYLNTKKVWQSKGGKIYVGDRTGLTGYLKASFSGNPPEDDMLVYLVCCDTTDKWDTEVIDVWQMDGPTAIDILSTIKGISLQKFINHGKKKRVNVKTIGWNKYIKTMLKRLPIKKSINLVNN
jgi:hypothetical protein